MNLKKESFLIFETGGSKFHPVNNLAERRLLVLKNHKILFLPNNIILLIHILYSFRPIIRDLVDFITYVNTQF